MTLSRCAVGLGGLLVFVGCEEAPCSPVANPAAWTPVAELPREHRVDGVFGANEWHESDRMEGALTDVYMDYDDGHLYVLNDWRSRVTNIPSGCFNFFGLTIGGARVELRVYGDGTVQVSGAELESEGAYGLGASPAWGVPHTIYEFSLAVESGQIDMCCTDPVGGDSCEMETDPTTFSILAGSAPSTARTIRRTEPRLGEGEACDRGLCGAGLTCAPGTHRCSRFTTDTPDARVELPDSAVEEPDAGADASHDAAGLDAPLL